MWIFSSISNVSHMCVNASIVIYEPEFGIVEHWTESKFTWKRLYFFDTHSSSIWPKANQIFRYFHTFFHEFPKISLRIQGQSSSWTRRDCSDFLPNSWADLSAWPLSTGLDSPHPSCQLGTWTKGPRSWPWDEADGLTHKPEMVSCCSVHLAQGKVANAFK